MTELDPVAIRISLASHRERGTDFETAWRDATDHNRAAYTDERSVYVFIKKHFRAAYYDDRTSGGRCFVPERETSNAVLIRRVHEAPTDFERCRSGDGCDREATHGRFGSAFCAGHHAELLRLSVKLDLDLDRANPRNGGNTSLFTHKAAA